MLQLHNDQVQPKLTLRSSTSCGDLDHSQYHSTHAHRHMIILRNTAVLTSRKLAMCSPQGDSKEILASLTSDKHPPELQSWPPYCRSKNMN
jgi:hypothetical protein